MCDSKYQIVLLDAEGFTLSDRPADNHKQAKNSMRYMLSDEFARMAETTHAIMGTYKVETRNSKGQCVLDQFISVGGAS
jgi:hypothetical protein